MNIEAEVFESGTVNYTMDMLFVNFSGQIYTFTLQDSPYDIEIDSEAVCTINDITFEKQITCDFSSVMKDGISITVNYKSDDTVDNKKNYFLFSKAFKVPIDVKTLSVLVKIPEGTALREPTEESYSPDEALVGSDGRRPIIAWERSNFKAGKTFDTTIAYEMINENIDYRNYIVVFVFGIIVIAIIFAVYKLRVKKETIKSLMPVLKEDEKKVMDALLKHGSGVNQKLIVKDSNYSKAKVSKVLKSLAERGLIKLERIGRKNRVYFGSEFKKEEQKDSGNN